jgi:hypothetical protein
MDQVLPHGLDQNAPPTLPGSGNERQQWRQEINLLDKANLHYTLMEATRGKNQILIWGPWEWQAGSDQLIRLLAGLDHSSDFCLTVVGSGPQEDEIRYLIHTLGFDPYKVVRLAEVQYRDPDLKAHWIRQAEVVIEKIEADNNAWRIQAGQTRS